MLTGFLDAPEIGSLRGVFASRVSGWFPAAGWESYMRKAACENRKAASANPHVRGEKSGVSARCAHPTGVTPTGVGIGTVSPRRDRFLFGGVVTIRANSTACMF